MPRDPQPLADETCVAETIVLAVTLLRQIAEDPLLRPSYRASARKHLRRLFPPEERVVGAEGSQGSEPN